MISSAKERGKRISESLNSEYSSACFDYNYSNSKQKALKVYMNTFYGKAGNSKSLIFLCELTGRTTSGNLIRCKIMKNLCLVSFTQVYGVRLRKTYDGFVSFTQVYT